MAQKEYLKMKDVFQQSVYVDSGDHYNGWSIVKHSDGCSIDESSDGGFYEKTADYIAHAINSHDELVDEVERLRGLVYRMFIMMHQAGEYPEAESFNPIKQWLYDVTTGTAK